jgi:hypothetical protein
MSPSKPFSRKQAAAASPPSLRGAPALATSAEAQILRGQLAALFRAIDKNGDGTVTRIELLLALRRDPGLADRLELPQHVRQEGSTRAMFERVFAEIDADGSDTLTLDEFCAHFERSPAGAGVGGAPALPLPVAGAAAVAHGSPMLLVEDVKDTAPAVAPASSAEVAFPASSALSASPSALEPAGIGRSGTAGTPGLVVAAAALHPFGDKLALPAPSPCANQIENTLAAMRSALAEAHDVDEDEAEDFLLLKVRSCALCPRPPVARVCAPRPADPRCRFLVVWQPAGSRCRARWDVADAPRRAVVGGSTGAAERRERRACARPLTATLRCRRGGCGAKRCGGAR